VLFGLCVVGMRVTVWPLFTLFLGVVVSFESFCVCLLDVSGSVVLLIFFVFVWGLSDWRLWTAGNARWTFAGCE